MISLWRRALATRVSKDKLLAEIGFRKSTDRPKCTRYCSCKATCCCWSTWNLDWSAMHCLWKYFISSICLTSFSVSLSSSGEDDPDDPDDPDPFVSFVSFVSWVPDDAPNAPGDKFCKPTTAARVSRALFSVFVWPFSIVWDVVYGPIPAPGSVLCLLWGLKSLPLISRMSVAISLLRGDSTRRERPYAQWFTSKKSFSVILSTSSGSSLWLSDRNRRIVPL